VEEPTRDEAVEILRGLRMRFEEHHGIEIQPSALEAAVDLSIR
jgi:ATP-dependent Clp protease ATP-binding subunit ClpC